MVLTGTGEMQQVRFLLFLLANSCAWQISPNYSNSGFFFTVPFFIGLQHIKEVSLFAFYKLVNGSIPQ